MERRSIFSTFFKPVSDHVQECFNEASLYRDSAEVSPEQLKTVDGRLFTANGVVKLKITDARDSDVVLVSTQRLGDQNPDGDFFAFGTLALYQLKGVPVIGAACAELVCLTDDVTVPEGFREEKIQFVPPPYFISPVAGSVFDTLVSEKLSSEPVTKKQRNSMTSTGEQAFSASIPGAEDGGTTRNYKTFTDLDGVPYPVADKKDVQDRMDSYNAVVRMASKDQLSLILGGFYVRKFNAQEIQGRFEEKLGMIRSMVPGDPFTTVGFLLQLRDTPVQMSFDKLTRFLQCRWERSRPVLLSLMDFYPGPRTDVYPPRAGNCTPTFIAALILMFRNLELSLRVYFGNEYTDCLRPVIQKLEDPMNNLHLFKMRWVWFELEVPLQQLSRRLNYEVSTDGSIRGASTVAELIASAYRAKELPSTQEHKIDQDNFIARVSPTIDFGEVGATYNPFQGDFRSRSGGRVAGRGHGREGRARDGLDFTDRGRGGRGRSGGVKSDPAPWCFAHFRHQLGLSQQRCVREPCRFRHVVLAKISADDARCALESIPMNVDLRTRMSAAVDSFQGFKSK